VETPTAGVCLINVNTGAVEPVVSTKSRKHGSSLGWTRDGRYLFGMLCHGEVFRLDDSGPDITLFPGAGGGEVVAQLEQYVFCADMETRDVALLSTLNTHDDTPVAVVEPPEGVAALLAGMKERRESYLARLKSPVDSERYQGMHELEWTADDIALETAIDMYFDDPNTKVREMACGYLRLVGWQRFCQVFDDHSYPDSVYVIDKGWVPNSPEPAEAKEKRLRSLREGLKRAAAEHRAEYGPSVSLDP